METHSECLICYDILQNKIMHQLKCNHIFHRHCLLQSFRASKQRECPYCRTPYDPLVYHVMDGKRLKHFHERNTLEDNNVSVV